MVKPAHIRLEWRGVFGSANAPSEQWSWSMNHADTEEMASDAALTNMALLMRNNWNNELRAITPSNIVLTQTRVARIGDPPIPLMTGSTRRRADGSLEQGIWTGASAGTLGPINAPPQLAVCVTLTTARVGPTGKGRLFLPLMHPPTLEDRRLDAASAGQIATAIRNMISDTNGTVGFGSVSVVSSKGAVSPVTGVRVGRAVDTIRSRRSSLPEDYVNLAI